MQVQKGSFKGAAAQRPRAIGERLRLTARSENKKAGVQPRRGAGAFLAPFCAHKKVPRGPGAALAPGAIVQTGTPVKSHPGPGTADAEAPPGQIDSAAPIEVAWVAFSGIMKSTP